MTIGGIVLTIFISILILSIGGTIGFYIIDDGKKIGGIIVIIITIGLVIGTIFTAKWYFKILKVEREQLKHRKVILIKVLKEKLMFMMLMER